MMSALCCMAVGLYSCGGSDSGTANEAGSLAIRRMDLAVERYAGLDSAARDSVLLLYHRPLSFLFALTGKGEPADSSVMDYSRSRSVAAFTPLVDSLLPDLDSIETALGTIDRRLAKLLPDAKIGEIYSIVSPYNQSIFTTDSLMLVGLNHYLGADFDGYSYFEPYQRINKRIGRLPYDVAEAAVGSAYPMTDTNDLTVLNHLLYQGAMIEAEMQLVPDADLADALGYTPEQLDWAQANESQAWNALIARNLLYSPSLTDAERLILPAPATNILHPESPGRMGRYIGYRIVQAYLRSRTTATLQYLLSPEFYAGASTLIDAGYSPTKHK